MPTRKRYRHFGTRYVLIELSWFLLIVVPIAFWMWRSSKGGLVFWEWMGVGALFILWVGAGYWLQFVATRIRCPQCNTVLRSNKKQEEEHDRYAFLCRTCDVLWTTGVKVSDDHGDGHPHGPPD